MHNLFLREVAGYVVRAACRRSQKFSADGRNRVVDAFLAMNSSGSGNGKSHTALVPSIPSLAAAEMLHTASTQLDVCIMN